MQAAPYFVLGTHSGDVAMRYRVATPWDFSQDYQLTNFAITPSQRLQPAVDWHAHIVGKQGDRFIVNGHVEIRWSHGKLDGPPEAKVYLDTDPLLVPGYNPL